MSEKLCLQWSDFNQNVNNAFGRLQNDKDFSDVTLACEDGQQIQAHKVILAASSPFFEDILQKIKHPQPLIYLKGYPSRIFASILDFLYCGEANVLQEDLDTFLAIADDIKLKGLTGQTSSDKLEEQENPKPYEPNAQSLFSESTTSQRDMMPKTTSKALAIPNQSDKDLQALNDKVISLTEKGEKMIPNGKRENGTTKLAQSYICKVCKKEDKWFNIRKHIEASHIDGISIPCDICDNTFSSRRRLGEHKQRFHK